MRRSRRRTDAPVPPSATTDAAPDDAVPPPEPAAPQDRLPVELPPAAGLPTAGMPPAATLARGRGRLLSDEAAGGYLFDFGPLRYRVTTGPREAPSALLRIDVGVEHGEWASVCRYAGMLIRDPSGAVFTPGQAAERLQVSELKSVIRGKILTLRYTESLGDLTLRRTLQLRLVGSSLVLQLSAAESAPAPAAAPAGRPRRGRGKTRQADSPVPTSAAGYCGFSFGTLGDAGARETLIPYTVDPTYL